MPRGDGTGPFGYGPMTGRGAGFCAGNGVPGYANQGFIRGRGFGGGGRGWRNRYFATGLPGWARPFGYNQLPGYPAGANYAEYTPERELEALKNQADFFQGQLETLNQRIRELEEIAAKKRASSE